MERFAGRRRFRHHHQSGASIPKNVPHPPVPKYERVNVAGKLTAFEPILNQTLTADSHRPKQGRRSGRALFAQIQAQGYRGGYSAVTD